MSGKGRGKMRTLECRGYH